MARTIIVGGGVYGTAIAWGLASRGVEVQLLEAQTVASGASGGPGRRGVRANYRDHRELPLMARAREIWPGLHETLGTDPLFERTGHLMLIERERDLANAEARVVLQNRHGIPTSMLPAAAVRDLEPGVAPSIIAAVHCPGDGVSDHTATTKAFAAKANEVGVDLRQGVRIANVIERNGRAAALETVDGEEIAIGGDLFLFANSSVRDLVRPWAELPTWNLALQVLVSRPLADNPVRHLIGHASRTLSLKAEEGGRLMISGGHLGHWDPETRTGSALPDAIKANVADAVAVYPSLAGLEVEVADANHLEAESLDSIPTIDRVPGLSNAFMGCGWTGHGWAIAPAVAELVTSWALDGTRPQALAPFGYARFATQS